MRGEPMPFAAPVERRPRVALAPRRLHVAARNCRLEGRAHGAKLRHAARAGARRREIPVKCAAKQVVLPDARVRWPDAMSYPQTGMLPRWPHQGFSPKVLYNPYMESHQIGNLLSRFFGGKVGERFWDSDFGLFPFNNRHG
jgi:hypothetical protein